MDFVEEREDGYYDIIFMDIQMPKLNGYDEDVHAAKTVGMNEHIAKPLDLKALVKTLNHWLGKET